MLSNNLRVLIVDNDVDSRDLLRFLFEQQGVQVVAASCAAEAIELAKHYSPNLLLSEIVLPEEDGYELVGKIKALAKQQHYSVVAIATTSYATTADQVRVIKAGFQAHVVKPLDLNQLTSLVTRLCDR